MSAPLEVNSQSFGGVYTLNKGLSDNLDEVLRIQGMGWAKRKIITTATPTLYIKHFKDSDGREHVQSIQEGPVGLKGNSEERLLNGERVQQESPAFGPVVHSIRRASIDDIDCDWQKEAWSPDTIENGFIIARLEGDTSKGAKSWITSQVWGYSVDFPDGNRRHVRKIHVKGHDGEVANCRLVYDYKGPNTKA